MNAPGPQANENFQCADVDSRARRVQNRQPGVRLRKASQEIEDWFSSNPNILQPMDLRVLHWRSNRQPRRAAMHGKVVVITGGTSGIGQVAAERLAGMGARIVLVGRDKARGEVALERLRERAP